MKSITKILVIATIFSFFTPSVNAQSLTERNICKQSGEYAVFARHPLFIGADKIDKFLSLTPSVYPILRNKAVRDFTNTDLTHEHIFFCRDSSIVSNIGFGPAVGEQNFEIVGQKITLNLIGNRFSYSPNELATGRGKDGGRLDDFVPIDNEKYNSEIVQGILSGVTAITPDRCDIRQVGDGTYLGVINNCQGFTARVQKEYWRKMFAGRWRSNGYTCETGELTEKVQISVSGNSLVAKKITGDNCVPAGNITFQGTIPESVSKGSSFSVTFKTGTSDRPACCSAEHQLSIVDANTFTAWGIRFTRID
jgi:hypothetical protein